MKTNLISHLELCGLLSDDAERLENVDLLAGRSRDRDCERFRAADGFNDNDDTFATPLERLLLTLFETELLFGVIGFRL